MGQAFPPTYSIPSNLGAALALGQQLPRFYCQLAFAAEISDWGLGARLGRGADMFAGMFCLPCPCTVFKIIIIKYAKNLEFPCNSGFPAS